MSDQLSLFDDDPALLYGEPVIVVGVCHWCGAHTPTEGPEAIPLTESGDRGDKWTGAMWASIALGSHFDVCPERPKETQ